MEDFLHTTPSEATKGLKILRRSIQDSWKKVFEAGVYPTQSTKWIEMDAETE